MGTRPDPDGQKELRKAKDVQRCSHGETGPSKGLEWTYRNARGCQEEKGCSEPDSDTINGRLPSADHTPGTVGTP